MKRMTFRIPRLIGALTLVFGLAYSETNGDEQTLENLVNSAKSNAKAYQAERDVKNPATSNIAEPQKENPAAVPEKTTNNYVTIPFSFSVIPFWGYGFKTIVNVQMNIGAGYSDRLNGAAVGFVNIVGENAKGVDCSLVSITGGDFHGAQFSLVTVTGNDFQGVQGGLVNFVGGNFSYAQAGLVNLVGGNFDGFQAGLVNAGGGRFKGGQAGLVNLNRMDFKGPQVGLVNVADQIQGIQIGLVNIAGEMDGVSIGLVSVVAKNGQTHGQFWIDETGFVNAAFIHGSKTVYNIYTVGMDVNADLWTYGLGLGVHIPLDPFYVNIEGLSSSVSHIERWDGMNTVHRLRVYIGFSLFEHLSFIAGASLNYYRNWNDNDGNTVNINPFYNVSKSFSNNDKLWPGLFAGVTF